MRCTVDNSVVERQAADKSQLRIVFIKLVKPPGVVFMPLEPIHRIYQIILKEICVLEYAILLPLVFAGFQITVIHIVERCKTFKNVSVFFQQIPPEVAP